MAALIVAALCFSFSAEGLGPVFITAFTDHSHEARVFQEGGKTRLILVHDHDAAESAGHPAPTEHPDHEFEFMDQDMPFRLAGGLGAFSFPVLIHLHLSHSSLYPGPVVKPHFPSHSPRPQTSLLQVRSVVILV